MKIKVILFILLFILSPLVQATASCCPPDGHVCGDQCCDGRPLSAQCGRIKIIQLPPAVMPESDAALKQKTKKEEAEIRVPPPERLYVWTDPDSSTPYLSTTMPPWYRNKHYVGRKQPGVWVYDQFHRLLDHPDRQLSAEQIEQLRQEALTIQRQQEALKKRQHQSPAADAQADELVAAIQTALAQQHIIIGMNEAQVKQVWESPETEKTLSDDGKVKRVLTYADGREVTLVDDKVTAFTEKVGRESGLGE